MGSVKFDVQVWHVSAMNRQCNSFILQLDILQHASYCEYYRKLVTSKLVLPNHILYSNSILHIKETFIFDEYSLLFGNYLLPHFRSIHFGVESISFFDRFLCWKVSIYHQRYARFSKIKQSSNVYETVAVNLFNKKKEHFWVEGWV